MKRNLPVWLAPALALFVFFLAGLALIPYPGLQNDELFFSGPIFAADAAFYNIEIGAWKIPGMVMSYTGALKTWIYQAIFQFLEPTEWSVRIPVLLMGMATIWLTWVWVRRLAGVRAAGIAAVLLATDTIFLMTNTFDWGPVALQHILLMGGLAALDRWVRQGGDRMLALGFFLWGLGMWDKALLAWPLGGLAVASFCIFPRETLRRVRPRPLAIAAVAFLIGAAPLVWYNVDRRGETATANARFTAEGIGGKVTALRQTADGSTLFGYMVYTKPGDFGIRPRNAVGRASAWISSIAGNHHRNAMVPAYVVALLCLGLLWRSPPRGVLLFLLVTTSVAWAQMAFNKGTGGASHHAILLWPFPVVFLAIAFDRAAATIPRYGPAVLATAVGFLALENLLTTNEYLTAFAVNGASGGWTDAIYRLAGSVEKSETVGWYGLVDWGYLNGLRLVHEGDLPVFIAQVPAAGVTPSEADLAEIKREIDSPDRIFIQHTDDKQMFPGINGRWRDVVAKLGYSERVVKVVHDRNGRPVFELFRVEKAQ
jgi:4-amino-4-deoxy-L-arabinose transferase-like glycosyltransferase